MKIYHYDPATGELLGSSEAEPNPMEPGKHLVPAYATDQQPPAVAALQVAVFEAGIWVLKEDHRSEQYYSKTDGTLFPITFFGAVPDTLTKLPRPSSLYKWDAAVGAWAFDTELALSAIRAKRDGLLTESDWTQLSDSPLTDTIKLAWKTYRQELRDFPAICDPANPVWPTEPA